MNANRSPIQKVQNLERVMGGRGRARLAAFQIGDDHPGNAGHADHQADEIKDVDEFGSVHLAAGRGLRRRRWRLGHGSLLIGNHRNKASGCRAVWPSRLAILSPLADKRAS